MITHYQQAIINDVQGESYVIAGAGAGKTATILLRTLTLKPWECLLLAYNKDAAKEMETRLGKSQVRAWTMHAWAWRTLCKLYHNAPWTRPQAIIGTKEGIPAADLVFKAMRAIDHDLDDWRSLHEAYGVVQEAVAGGEPFTEALQRALQVKELTEDEEAMWQLRFDAYEEQKRKVGGIDFCDMTVLMLKWIDHYGIQKLGTDVEPYLRHVVMDEGQDANSARIALFNRLSALCLSRGGSSLVVGDPRQAINGWTGARPDLFRAQAGKSGVKVYPLPITWRSSQRIIYAGNCLSDPTLPATEARPGAPVGEPIYLYESDDVSDEIRGTVERLKYRWDKGCTPVDVAYLGRTHSFLAYVECVLAMQGIGVQRAEGMPGLWGSVPAERLLAYMRVWEAKVFTWDGLKIINKPTRYCKVAPLVAALRVSDAGTLTASEVAKVGGKGGIRLADDLEKFWELSWPAAVRKARDWLSKPLKTAQSQAHPSVANADMLAMYQTLAQVLIDAKGVDFALGLGDKLANAPWRVTLSSIHAAKGREWEDVVVTGVSAGLLPHKFAKDDEEEKRLLYVAITRAKNQCEITYHDKRSPFLHALVHAGAVVEEHP